MHHLSPSNPYNIFTTRRRDEGNARLAEGGVANESEKTAKTITRAQRSGYVCWSDMKVGYYLISQPHSSTWREIAPCFFWFLFAHTKWFSSLRFSYLCCKLCSFNFRSAYYRSSRHLFTFFALHFSRACTFGLLFAYPLFSIGTFFAILEISEKKIPFHPPSRCT